MVDRVLKDLLRSRAVQWSVNKDRLESIAEHTYGCMILAISLQSELELNVDLSKVLEIIPVHELEELSIGDITPLDKIDKNSLRDQARDFVYNLVKNLNCADRLMELIDEFEEEKTKRCINLIWTPNVGLNQQDGFLHYEINTSFLFTLPY